VDAAAFCTQARVMIVAGKGGVGKTTVTAALALLAARSGLSPLIVEVEGASGLPNLFDLATPLDYHPTALVPAGPGRPEVRARTLTPDDALVEYLEDHSMRRISRRLSSTGTLDVVATAVPGIKDILVLGKIKQLERAAAAGQPDAPDVILVDAPAAGHAVTFLASAHGLVDVAAVGPIRSQAADVIELLSDPTRCQVMLVTLPEETPVNEVVETAFHLEDRAGVQLAPVVVNSLYPPLDLPEAPPETMAEAVGVQLSRAEAKALAEAADFRRHRQALEAAQVARLAEALPLPQLRLPHLFTTELGRPEAEQLTDALAEAVAALPSSVRER
jgi:anion-transporting  ArsA/GET3 family ATPase